MGDTRIDRLYVSSYNVDKRSKQEVIPTPHAEHSHLKEQALYSPHTHHHEHTQTKAVINRLSRAIGHLESVKRMVENGQDCAEVLIQLAAVKSAINNTGKIILQDHIEHCLVDAMENGNQESIELLNKAIERFIK